MTNKTGNILRKHLAAAGIASCVLLTLLCIVPAGGLAADAFLPSFGGGKVKVRIYSDYFCPPCRDMVPDLEPVIRELVDDGVIDLTFTDTPFYKYSSLYVRYFLYAVNEKRDLEQALYVRRSLMEAAKSMVDNAEKLEAFLKKKKIALKPFDLGPTFKAMSGCLEKDRIDATPSCVIEKDGKKNKYIGADDIIGALNRLKQEKS